MMCFYFEMCSSLMHSPRDTELIAVSSYTELHVTYQPIRNTTCVTYFINGTLHYRSIVPGISVCVLQTS